LERLRTSDEPIDLFVNVIDILKLPGGKEIESWVTVKEGRLE
jgi:hypothetical protein